MARLTILLACLLAACSSSTAPADARGSLDRAALDTRAPDLQRDAPQSDLPADGSAGDLASSPTKVDIIWVVLESTYLTQVRKDIKAAAVSLFGYASLKNLDVRMGVTGSCRPGEFGVPAGAAGKLCSATATPDGGTDRFLLPADHAAFGDCIDNPPYSCLTGNGRAGLLGAREAVKKHLPRAVGDLSKIRVGAKLVVILVTNSYDELVENLLSPPADWSKCVLDSITQNAVNKAVAPEIAYLKGTPDVEAKVDQFHVFATPCGSSCFFTPAELPHGSKEVSAKLGGAIHDACKPIVPQVKAILDGLAGLSVPKG